MDGSLRQIGKGSLHVLLGGMLAASFALLAFSFFASFEQARADGGGTSLWGLTFLGILVVIVVTTITTTPPVRPLEVAAARYLLVLDLPEIQAPRSWSSRWRGALWLALNVLVGGIVLLALLVLVPIGVGLALFPFGSTSALDIPTLPTVQVHSGLEAWWVAALSPVPIVVAVVLTAFATVALRRTAPSLLGPTDADRLVSAGLRELKLAQDNQLARDIHDSVGHALTAIGIQAEAGARVLDHNPDFARSALTAIQHSSATALAELDNVLGLLRGQPAVEPNRRLFEDVHAMLEHVAPDAHFTHDGGIVHVSPDIAANAFRIAQEAITNAVKYGTAPISLHISAHETIEIVCRNALPAIATRPEQARESAGGRGLAGMTERALLSGGTVEIIHDKDSWTVQAVLPADTTASLHTEPK